MAEFIKNTNPVTGEEQYPITSPDAVIDSNGNTLTENMGDLADLGTTDKSNLVAAINEVEEEVADIETKTENILSENLEETDEEILFMDDEESEKFVSIGEYGIKSKGYYTDNETPLLSWSGKKIAFYGDSVTNINEGDYTNPYGDLSQSQKWALRVAKYLGFAAVHGRGIGGQSFLWGADGSSNALAWLSKTTGEYVGRTNEYSYDDYLADPSIVSELSGYDSINHTLVRGTLSSWLRIKSSFPQSIKDTIDIVCVMAHNDADFGNTKLNASYSWITDNITDIEWSASDFYSTYGGDYNVTDSARGAIASTIMKLQAWMPNAIIVIMTPISGKGSTGQLNPVNDKSATMRTLAEAVRDISRNFAIPCIDINANDGINCLNRTEYITDSIHPYSVKGSKMVARAVIGGLKSIVPNL